MTLARGSWRIFVQPSVFHLDFAATTTLHHRVNNMPSRSIARVLPSNGLSFVAELPPAFLAPAIYRPFSPFTSQCSKFSTSPVSSRDLSRWRGVSAIHRTGPKRKLIVSDYPLPTPAPARVQEKRAENPNHGLWGFFGPNKEAVPTPEEDYAVGTHCVRTCVVDPSANIPFARPCLVYPGVAAEVLGRPPSSLVGLCQGT